MRKNSLYKVYLVLIFFILLVPFAGMSRWATNETAEKTELPTWPTVEKKNQLNWHYFQEMGTYFESRFAFKEWMVTENNEIRSQLLGSEANSKVVVGKDGWLFFNATLADYLGKNQLTDRELFMITQNLRMMKDYCESIDANFLFVAPPNKNSVYGAYMPDRYLQSATNNYNRLLPYLEAGEIPYIDLKSTFLAAEEELYFKKDTHWNEKGAFLGYQEIMSAFHLSYESYLNVPKIDLGKTHMGDIDIMLYPKNPTPEADFSYPHQFAFQNEIDDFMTPWIATANEKANGTLFMYRDSFGEKLAPLLADNFNQAYFTRYVPYNFDSLTQYQPTHVIVERAERNLQNLVTDVPVLSGLPVLLQTGETIASETQMKVTEEEGYYIFAGEVDPEFVNKETKIYITITDETGSRSFEPFYLSDSQHHGNGYQLRLLKEKLATGEKQVAVIVRNDFENQVIYKQDITIK